jgi:DDE superfamily endonuclease
MAIMTVIGVFAPLFSKRVCASVKLVVVGAILAPGQRTVTAVLRVMGKSAAAHFQNYHRVLNRAQWSALDASRRLLELLVDVFVPQGPVVMGIDETMERRRGERITAKGVYRDPVRSSPAPFVKASRWRGVCLVVLARLSWADRVWALPCMTVLAPAERYDQSQGRQPHSRLDRARQMVRLVQRGLPSRALVGVGASPYAALEWRDAGRESACVITRWRLDAAL